MSREAGPRPDALAGFFEGLPHAAWLVFRDDWHQANGNLRAAALCEGKPGVTLEQLDGLIRVADGAPGPVSHCVAAVFASGAEERFPARWGSGGGAEMTVATWPVLEEGEVVAAAILLAEAGPARIAPADWWLRVGHDLRGPVSPMRMAVQMIGSGRLEERDRDDALRIMDRQIDSLLARIDEIGDLLRLDAGLYQADIRRGDLAVILDAVEGRSAGLKPLQDRGQTLKVVLPAHPVVADHDPKRLIAVLDFLIMACAAHSPRGAELTLTLALDEQGGRARFEVAGAEPTLASDPDLAFVTGESDAIGDREARTVLVRELARRQHLVFASGGRTGICFSLPAVS